MTDRELMQEALEAMLSAINAGDWKVDGACDPHATIIRLTNRLAHPEPEPVAWFIQYEYRHEFLWREPTPYERNSALEIKPLYTAPVHAIDISQERVDETAKSEHDIVGACVTCGAPHGFWLSAPPTDFISPSVIKAISKREWVGLTEYQRLKFADRFHIAMDAVEAIEAKLKEKNT